MAMKRPGPTRWRLAALAQTAALTAALTGCVGPSPMPTPSPTATTNPPLSPTPTPAADPLDGVVALVATAETLDLRDRDGALVEQFHYLDQPAGVIDALSIVFGAAPVDEESPGSNHTPPSTSHVWGDVEIEERHYDEARREAESIGMSWPRFSVYFDAPTYDDVELTTPSGYQAGDILADLAPGFDSDDWTCVGQGVDVVTIDEYVEWQGGNVEREYGVALANWDSMGGPPDGVDDEGTVIWIGAPYVVAEGCA